MVDTLVMLHFRKFFRLHGAVGPKNVPLVAFFVVGELPKEDFFRNVTDYFVFCAADITDYI
jgi:hypothetical protein